ncbi:MAG TPA: thioredoxin family protein [Polyangiaceae bacterium]
MLVCRFLVVMSLAALLGCKQKGDAAPEPRADAIESAALPPPPPPDASAAPAWNYPAVSWRSADYALTKMRVERRPGLVVVMADWCSSCERYRALFQDPEIVELSKSFEMILIESDTSPQRAAAWQVDGAYVPRTFVATPDGEVDRSFRTSNPKYAHFFNDAERDALVSTLRQAAAKYSRGG